MNAEQLRGMAIAIDGLAEERGWNSGHLMVMIEPSPEPDHIDFGIKPFDDHPLQILQGFRAPEEWLGIGLCCEGWGSRDLTVRPSQAKGRVRIRTVVLVIRDGLVVSGLRLAGEDFTIKDDVPEGTVLEALRRTLV